MAVHFDRDSGGWLKRDLVAPTPQRAFLRLEIAIIVFPPLRDPGVINGVVPEESSAARTQRRCDPQHIPAQHKRDYNTGAACTRGYGRESAPRCQNRMPVSSWYNQHSGAPKPRCIKPETRGA